MGIKIERDIMNLAALDNWYEHEGLKHSLKKHFILSLANTLKEGKALRITSSNVDEPTAEVLVWLATPFWARVRNNIHQAHTWYTESFSKDFKPLWMKPWEWQWVITVKDTRWEEPNDVVNAVLYKGTGFNGLNEFDLENAIRTTLAQHAVFTEVVFESKDPILGQVSTSL
jgi:hypothetical protein